jgi:multidrug transporter EmrE-like cation transporter
MTLEKQSSEKGNGAEGKGMLLVPRDRRKNVFLVLLVLIGSQTLFTTGDFLARMNMGKFGYHASTFFHPWFLAYFLIRQVAMFGQLYIFSQVPLGKTAAMFSGASLLISNVLSFLFLHEILSPIAYLGVALAITAVIVLAFR